MGRFVGVAGAALTSLVAGLRTIADCGCPRSMTETTCPRCGLDAPRSHKASIAWRCFLNTKRLILRSAGGSRASEVALEAPSRPRGTLGDDLSEAGDDVREAGGGEHGDHLWAKTTARRATSPVWCFLGNSEKRRGRKRRGHRPARPNPLRPQRPNRPGAILGLQ